MKKIKRKKIKRKKKKKRKEKLKKDSLFRKIISRKRGLEEDTEKNSGKKLDWDENEEDDTEKRIKEKIHK